MNNKKKKLKLQVQDANGKWQNISDVKAVSLFQPSINIYNSKDITPTIKALTANGYKVRRTRRYRRMVARMNNQRWDNIK